VLTRLYYAASPHEARCRLLRAAFPPADAGVEGERGRYFLSEQGRERAQAIQARRSLGSQLTLF
jgi:hypothetical protein